MKSYTARWIQKNKKRIALFLFELNEEKKTLRQIELRPSGQTRRQAGDSVQEERYLDAINNRNFLEPKLSGEISKEYFELLWNREDWFDKNYLVFETNDLEREYEKVCQVMRSRSIESSNPIKHNLVFWFHQNVNDPIAFISEWGEDQFEVRRIEIYQTGKTRRLENNSNALSEVPYSELEGINSDPNCWEFLQESISKDYFELIWNRKEWRVQSEIAKSPRELERSYYLVQDAMKTISSNGLALMNFLFFFWSLPE